jgi:phosphosulfolactate synthase
VARIVTGSDRPSTAGFLERLGVADLAPAVVPFDPGYSPVAVESHLAQSGHLMAGLKISMASWLIANEEQTRRKVFAAQAFGVCPIAGGSLFEVASHHDALEDYLELCARTGLQRIECAEGFTELDARPREVVAAAASRGLQVQFELGRKHDGPMTARQVQELIDQGRAWLDAGAVMLVVEARESATDVGLFTAAGELNAALAERFAEAFPPEVLLFEAPTKASQFALLRHFGPRVMLGNVRLEEVLRVEIYRRGLHSDAFGRENLRPAPPAGDRV